MPSIDCKDEVRIDAPTGIVFKVVSDYPNWKDWMPIYKCYLLNSDIVKEGAEIRHQYGYKPIIISDFVRRIEKIESNIAIHESYISGGLLGKGVWQFVQEGNETVASFHCMVTSNNLLNSLLFLIMGKRAHRNVYEPLLQKLKAYCEGKSPTKPGRRP